MRAFRFFFLSLRDILDLHTLKRTHHCAESSFSLMLVESWGHTLKRERAPKSEIPGSRSLLTLVGLFFDTRLLQMLLYSY
jgi:hypothetical protein